MKYFILSALVLTLVSCKDSDGKDNSFIFGKDTVPSEKELNGISDIDDDEAVNDIIATKVYKFSSLTGKCTDETDLLGFNREFGDCADLSGSYVTENLKKKVPWSLNLVDATVSKDSKTNFGRLAYAEGIVNELTVFEGQKKGFTKLTKGHLNSKKRIEKQYTKNKKNYEKELKRLENLKNAYNKTTKEKKKERLAKRMIASKEKIEKLKMQRSIYNAKKIRHNDYSKNVYELAKDLEAAKIKDFE